MITIHHNKFDARFACLKNQVGNTVLYIFLLPFVSKDKEYIVKVGYTKDIIQRHSDLKKEFGVDDIYLMYVYQISGEHIELNLHDELKKLISTRVYYMEKAIKKFEKYVISEETYILDLQLLKNILYIIYNTYTKMDKISIMKMENELVVNKKELVIKENEGKELDNEKIKLQIQLKDKDNENLRLQIELLKLQNEK